METACRRSGIIGKLEVTFKILKTIKAEFYAGAKVQ